MFSATFLKIAVTIILAVTSVTLLIVYATKKKKVCVTDCSDKNCAYFVSDGCGGVCPVVECEGGEKCEGGKCVQGCEPSCVPQSRVCGGDGCGGSCGSCPTGSRCEHDGKACSTPPPECVPSCPPAKEGEKRCGMDGCGGQCGNGCPHGDTCDYDVKTCTAGVAPINIFTESEYLQYVLSEQGQIINNTCFWNDPSARLYDDDFGVTQGAFKLKNAGGLPVIGNWKFYQHIGPIVNFPDFKIGLTPVTKTVNGKNYTFYKAVSGTTDVSIVPSPSEDCQDLSDELLLTIIYG